MKSLFATLVEQKPLKLAPATHKEILKTALTLPEVDDHGVEWSDTNYPNGYTSYGSLSRLHEQFSIFQELKTAIDREVKSFAKKLDLRIDRGQLELSSIWVNLMPKNCYHAFHFHPNSVVSGTYYVKVPKGTSPLRLEDPRAGLFMASPPRSIQNDIHANEGDIVLFESWLKHEVPPHHENHTRVSVSFNYDWIT